MRPVPPKYALHLNPAIGKRNNSMDERLRAQLPSSSDFGVTSWLQSTRSAVARLRSTCGESMSLGC